MSANDLSKRPGEDPAGLRARYNQLCMALTSIAGTNGGAAERVLQELQGLAQKIAIRQAEATKAEQSATGAGAAPRPAPGGNVIAFRCKVKGVEHENRRLSAVLNALADRPLREPAAQDLPAADAPSDAGAAASREPGVAPDSVVVPLAAHGRDIDRLLHRSDEHGQAIERFERQLGTSGPLSTLSVQVAAMRAENARQGQQMVSLATAVHRLAKLIAAQSEPGSRH